MLTIIYSILGYFFLTIVVRVLSRRPGAQMTLAEFVLIFLMGGVIITATAASDRSMTNCMCAVITIACLHRMVSTLKIRYPKFGVLLDGTPLVLVEHGEWKHDVIQGMSLAEEDIMAAARGSGAPRREDVEYAILERNGGISVMKREKKGGDQQQKQGGGSKGEMH